MSIRNHQKSHEAHWAHRPWGYALLAFAVAFCLVAWAAPSLADGKKKPGGGSKPAFCSATATTQLVACDAESTDDLFTAEAICINLSDEDERDDCEDEARQDFRDAKLFCREQLEARRELCRALGENRYEPDFDPAHFDANFASLTHPNPYFPLTIGNQWKYEGGDEEITIDVLDATKSIEGVTCIVVHDRVEVEGVVVEDTDDWFGQRKNGTVDYCGESSRSFELFAGDDPQEPELNSIDGSWKTGVDGALPGTLFLGAPVVGRVYRQEWSPGNAEDAARVISTNYGFGNDAELDAFVPKALAQLLCAGNKCVVTGEFSPLSPDGFERKYYAAGIGVFLEVHPDSGEITQLVDCNFDARCNSLPQP